MDILVIISVLLIMIVGIIGSIAPALPGTPLIMLAALGYAWYTDFKVISTATLIALLIIMCLSLLVDYFSGLVGAKKYGASKWGLLGAFIGGLLGLFLGLPGLIVGPFVGAFIGELVTGKGPEEAFLVGWGSLIGILGGGVIKVILALIMVIIFVIALF